MKFDHLKYGKRESEWKDRFELQPLQDRNFSYELIFFSKYIFFLDYNIKLEKNMTKKVFFTTQFKIQSRNQLINLDIKSLKVDQFQIN